jgi:hypothetical protein
MKNAIILFLTVVMVASAAAVWGAGGPPLGGTWKSTNGDFDEGTATSSWGVGAYLFRGGYIYGRSTQGAVFTNDWTISCPNVISVTTLVPSGPTGNAVYMYTYMGGFLTLGGPGNPWDGGDAVYTGIIDTYREIRTVQFVNGKIVGAVSDHSISAHFQGYPESCATWAIGNGVLRGTTPTGQFNSPPLQNSKPAGYPDYPQGGNCSLQKSGPGHWDDIRDLTLSITGCTVATEPTTWGNVKSMYRN